MASRRAFGLGGVVAAFALLPPWSTPAQADLNQRDANKVAENIDQLFSSATGTTNSDLAFWEDKAYVGNYDGFRIFDVSDPAHPELLSDVDCFGPQNDVSVWDGILVLSVDRTLTGPECGSGPTEDHADPTGWEGLRLFDVTDPGNPRFITDVYQDCGSHTHTLVPQPEQGRLLVYNSSYPLRPGPTCGPVRGPEAGRDPQHGVIQIVDIPLAAPWQAREVSEKPINYPGDADNVFDPADHSATGLNTLRACHDIGVMMGATAPGSRPGDLGLAAGACAEQAQLWRIGADGLPVTEEPLWVFDNPSDTDGPGGGDSAADFWHSATFSWDGQVVNFSDESFGDGCPPVTAIGRGAPEPNSDTGRTYFLSLVGGELSQFMIPRAEPNAYCSTHQGNVVATKDRYLLAQAWYMGGVDIVDFTDPRHPREIAYFDAGPDGPQGSDNWAHYWYEGPSLSDDSLVTYGQDGVHNPPTGRGFQAFEATVDAADVSLHHLNPQTQENVLFPNPPR